MVFESFFSLANSTCFSILIRMSEILFILIHSGQDVFCFQEIVIYSFRLMYKPLILINQLVSGSQLIWI